MVTAKQRAWRKKFGQMFGGKTKRTRLKTRVVYRAKKVYSMARRRFKRYSRRRSSGGLNGMIKPLAIGAIAGYLAPSVPVLNQIPTPAVGAGAGYLLGKKTIMGAGLGAIGAMFIPSLLSGFMGGRTTTGSMPFY